MAGQGNRQEGLSILGGQDFPGSLALVRNSLRVVESYQIFLFGFNLTWRTATEIDTTAHYSEKLALLLTPNV